MEAEGGARSLVSRWQRHWFEEARIDRAYARLARRLPPAAGPRGTSPVISVVMPVCRPDPAALSAAIASVRAQSWSGWELCMADDASMAPDVTALLYEAARSEARVRVVRLPERRGIAAATNAAAALAGGEYLAFLDHDDVLAPHALGVMAQAARANPGVGLLFSDEDQLRPGKCCPYFKPGCNADLLLQQNLVCHLAMIRREVFQLLGGIREGFDGAQDHDLALRTLALLGVQGMLHVPGVLYSWRQGSGAFSTVAASRCREAAGRAIASHLGAAATQAAEPGLPGWHAIRFAAPAEPPKVHVLPPGAADGDAEILLFLASSLRRPDEAELGALLGQLARPGVGCVGARLENARGRLVHGGYMLHPWRAADAAQGARGDPGYRGRFRLARAVSAVSGDCLMIRREVFRGIGGWRAEAADFAAVDLGLRLAQAGLRSVWTPAVRLAYRTVPRRRTRGAAWMRQCWGDALARDPYGNPHLRSHHGRLRLRTLGSA